MLERSRVLLRAQLGCSREAGTQKSLKHLVLGIVRCSGCLDGGRKRRIACAREAPRLALVRSEMGIWILRLAYVGAREKTARESSDTQECSRVLWSAWERSGARERSGVLGSAQERSGCSGALGSLGSARAAQERSGLSGALGPLGSAWVLGRSDAGACVGGSDKWENQRWDSSARLGTQVLSKVRAWEAALGMSGQCWEFVASIRTYIRG